MPLYPYKCEDCQKPFQMRIAYADYDSTKVVCPYCQSENVDRVLAKVRFKKFNKIDLNSWENDPTQMDDIEQDPKMLAQVLKQVGDEMGDDLGPEYDQVMSRLEAGESPEDIEKDMPGGMGQSGGDDYGEVFG